MNIHVSYIKDRRGKKTHVVIPYEEWELLTIKPEEPDAEDIAAIKRIIKRPSEDRQVAPIENPIRKARLQANVTQADLAEAMGITQGMLSRMEREGNTPRGGTVVRVKEALKGLASN